MNASNIMSRRTIVIVSPEASVVEAARLMVSLGISGLPVVDASKTVVGMITEGDLLRRVELGTQFHRRRWISSLLSPGRLAEEYVHTHGTKVADVMTPDVITAGCDTSLDEIVGLMEAKGIKRVPIVEHGRLVGMITRADLLRALVDRIARPGAMARSDGELLADVQAILNEEVWAPRASIRAQVMEGIVDLSGVIFDERERSALRVAAENVPGVRAVRDHLTWIEPVSGLAVASGAGM